ncbi:MAG: DMT family transporter [Planctomycetota bacterium]|jgi:multidrug transporter EmrE-like cation transporter
MKHAVALAIALLFNACANLLMKAGMTPVGDAGGLLKDGASGAVRTVLLSPVLVTGLVCFALNAACYMFALQSQALKISLAYPVMVGGGYAIIATVAYFLLHERMTPAQWVGVGLILAGVFIIAARTQGHPATPPAA